MKSIFNSTFFKNALAAVAVLVSVASTTYASSNRQVSLSSSGGFGDTSYASKGFDLSFASENLYLNAPVSAKEGFALGRTISATIVPDTNNVTVPENTSTIALLAMSCFLGLFFKKR